MHVTANDVGLDHLLAVEAGHDAERAVGGRVLRAQVQRHLLGLQLDVHPRVSRLGGDVRGLLALRDRRHPAGSSALAAPPGSGTSGMSSTSTSPGHGFTSRASSG